MRIAMIGQKGLPATYGGIEKHVEEIAVRLVQRGHEATVYCREDYTTDRAPYHGVHRLLRPSINTKHLGTATHVLASTLDAIFRGYDVVHYHALGPSLFSWLPRLGGKRTVVTVHGLDWQRAKWGRFARGCLRASEFASARFPDRTITISKGLRAYFETKYRRPIEYVPTGVESSQFREPQEIKKWGLDAGSYLLVVRAKGFARARSRVVSLKEREIVADLVVSMERSE